MTKKNDTQNDDTEMHTEAELEGERLENEHLEEALETLFGVGRMWAGHGLRVGMMALETSAHTLRATANTLGTLSDRFDREAGRRDPG